MSNSAPTSFVIMGITGDLSQKKLLPALMELYIKNALPQKFKVIGFSRRELSKEVFYNFVKESLIKKNKYNSSQIGSFLEHTEYVRGDFDNIDHFKKLKDRLREIDDNFGQCGNKLIYLSVPPSLYEMLFKNISTSKLSEPCDGDLGWARILVEKPFGRDDVTAQKLDNLLGKLFKEEQIFRIDHYLAKEALQNILTFRFSNTMFEPLWSNKHIDSVSINFYESNDVSTRGRFYDEIGALRDVGQNHILQMLALITMEKPKDLSCLNIRKERARVLSSLVVSKDKKDYVKAQYKGYKKIDGVDLDSNTETFFSIKAFLNNKRWKGVPLELTSGKALYESKVEIKVRFKDPDPESILPSQYKTQEQNILTFRIQPNEGISILFWFKVPGFESKIEPKTLNFNYSEGDDIIDIPDAYEKVIYDCIEGDQTLFTSTKEVEASWRYITDVIKKWKNIKMKEYEKGSKASSITKS